MDRSCLRLLTKKREDVPQAHPLSFNPLFNAYNGLFLDGHHVVGNRHLIIFPVAKIWIINGIIILDMYYIPPILYHGYI